MNAGAQPKPETIVKILEKIGANRHTIKQILDSINIDNSDYTKLEHSSKESFLVPIQSWNKCVQMLNNATTQFQDNEQYVHVSLQVSIPTGLNIIVDRSTERSEH